MDELKIPKLNKDNYTAWSIRTRAALVQKGCWEAIEPGYGLELKDEERKINEKALTFLFLVVEDEYLDDIADCTLAKEAWLSLKDINTKFGLLHTLQLLKELFNVTMQSGESINCYLGRLMDLHRKVSACGYSFTDREVALIILMGLPKQYEGLILNLERDEKELTTRIVKSRLIVEEKKLLRHQEYTREFVGDKALKTKDKSKKFQEAPKGTMRNERKTRCFACGEWGHVARYCFASKSSTHAKKALSADTQGKKTSFDWYLDSGATEHMCSQREKFIDLTPLKSEVEIANAEKIEVAGIGNIFLEPSPNCGKETIFLANVLYVPKLDGNLLSVGRIEEIGMTIFFQDGRAIIKNPKQNEIILTAHRNGRLYKIQEQMTQKACFSKHQEIIHRRLGHFHKYAIKKLVEENNLNSNKEETSKEDICSTCVLGKMKRSPFPKDTPNGAKRVLELIHTDVAGPITPTSKGGSRYIVTFVDDFSRYAVVKPMKCKSQVLEKFIEFKNKVENLHGLKIISLRSDNGGEYINNEFEDFLIENGISRQLTVPRTPQQNGVAEKMNHTLFDMTRCLLIDSGIPKELWADAITTACYLRNKCPSKAIEGNIPEELWTKKPSKINHLRIFGCKVYALIDRTQRKGKLDKRAQECVLLGYPEGVKGYKLWNVEEDKFFVSRNVKFDETVFPLRRSKPDNEINEKNELPFSIQDETPGIISSPTKSSNDTTEIKCTEEDLSNKQFVTNECIEIDEEESSHSQAITNLEEQFVPRRSNRERKQTSYYGDPVLYKAVYEADNITKDPVTVKEAMESSYAKEWKEAMQEELSNLRSKRTWELVPKPPNIRPIGCKWIFKRKRNAEGKVIKFKARLVAKGYSQVPGKDFTETFSPVVKIKSIRILLALAVELDMDIHQMDITAAYLNGTLKEDIYMLQPEGVQEKGKEHLVCHLKRALYGLKQSGREWNKCFDVFLKNCGLLRSKSDPCIYFHPDKTLYLGIYVDDMLIVGKSKDINMFKSKVMEEFEAKDLGEVNEILSMKIQKQPDGSLTLDQTSYIEDILDMFEVSSIKGASTPLDPSVKHRKTDDAEWNKIKETSANLPYRQAIGSLLYLACGTRPDIAFSATYMSQFNERPSDIHWRSIKHIFRYLKETKSLVLHFRKTSKKIEIFSDADWGADHVDRKSFSGYVIIFGGAAVSWSSKKQSTTALSSAEAEYIAITHVAKEVLWIRGLLQELGAEKFIPSPVPVKIDNQAAMFIAKNHVTSERSKHIDIKEHFIRDLVDQNVISLQYVKSENNVADLLTKVISKKTLLNLRKYLGFNV